MCSIMGYCAEDADHALFKECFYKTLSRVPDDSLIVNTGKGLLFQKGAARLRQTAGANCKCLRTLPLR